VHAPDAHAELRAFIERRGVAMRTDGTGVHWGPGDAAQDAWECFKAFVAVPASTPVERYEGICTVEADQDGDMLLFQGGVGRALEPDRRGYAPEGPGRPVFELNVTRQFSYTDADGEYAGMNQMGLSFEAPVAPSLDGVSLPSEWGRVGEDAARWIALVEDSTAFAHVVAGGQATCFYIAQSDV
jgi:hypothetical protein